MRSLTLMRRRKATSKAFRLSIELKEPKTTDNTSFWMIPLTSLLAFIKGRE